MPLLGKAAMLLCFDIVQEAVSEHDEWHTHEHLPERLSIPGFLRGTRWVALRGQPRYFVLYEVENLDTLACGAYLERLNHPTPWTARMMAQYRGMTRGLCSVMGSSGYGMGHLGLLARFKPAPGAESLLGDWLSRDIVAQLPKRPGIGSVHWLHGARTPQMTHEQSIRGVDAGVDWALLATGYGRDALEEVAQADLGSKQLADHGATDAVTALYRTDYTLSASEIAEAVWVQNRRHTCVASGTDCMEEAMTGEKCVLVVGLDPTRIDFSQPGYPPGMNTTKVLAGIKSSEDELIRLGYAVQTCLTDFGETAEAVVRDQLRQKRFNCVLIGAGVRANPSNFLLFEKLINVVHEHAPQAKICFNQLPSDIADAVKRWL